MAAGLAAASSVRIDAQSLGAFRWQLQPFCNVLTVTIVQQGGQYHVDGSDDGRRAHPYRRAHQPGGAGRIAHAGAVGGGIRVTHCADALCAAATSSTIGPTELGGGVPSVAIGGDGFPVIAWHTFLPPNSNESLQITKGLSRRCTELRVDPLSSDFPLSPV